MKTIKERQKLYIVTLCGLFPCRNPSYYKSYVVATDAESAYQKVRNYLEERSYGASSDRELKSVELLAEDCLYPDTRAKLFM